jgi:N-acetylneuraminate synthase
MCARYSIAVALDLTKNFRTDILYTATMSKPPSVFVIAEIGQAHDGSLGILHSYIDAVANTGINAIKFQTHVAEAESSPLELFRVKFSYVDETRQDYWRRMEFTVEQWAGIKEHCEAVGLEFMSTPSCLAAVDILERVGVERFKIGSGDMGNRLLLQRVARTGKEIILSSGLSSFEEIDEAVRLISSFGNRLVVMQCTSDYPVAPSRTGLNLINTYRARYPHPIGLSDHSGTIYPSLAAVAMGASYIEIHTVFDRRMFGPDSASSIEIDELKQMVSGIRIIEQSLYSDFNKSYSDEHKRMRNMFGKTLCVRHAMSAGDILKVDDLESKKPAGRGIPARDYEKVVGKSLCRDLIQWDFLRIEDISEDNREQD